MEEVLVGLVTLRLDVQYQVYGSNAQKSCHIKRFQSFMCFKYGTHAGDQHIIFFTSYVR